MAKARDIAGFADAHSFREAAAMTIAVRAEEVFEHSQGVLDTRDIERVHDMRVATRRLRAALEIFAVCFPKREHRRLLKEVKSLADALGERRDADVAIDSLERIGAALTADDRHGIALMVDDLRARQASGNDALALMLRQVERNGLRERLLAAAAAAGAAAAGAAADGFAHAAPDGKGRRP